MHFTHFHRKFRQGGNVSGEKIVNKAVQGYSQIVHVTLQIQRFKWSGSLKNRAKNRKSVQCTVINSNPTFPHHNFSRYGGNNLQHAFPTRGKIPVRICLLCTGRLGIFSLDIFIRAGLHA